VNEHRHCGAHRVVPPGRPGLAEVLDQLLVAERGEAMRGKLSEDPDRIRTHNPAYSPPPSRVGAYEVADDGTLLAIPDHPTRRSKRRHEIRRPMTQTDTLLQNNEAYASTFDKGDLPRPPGRRLAVLACMDARLDPARALGLEEGDAHVIRNAGGVVTDDALRSLAISQNLVGTEEIVLIHHTDCGMLTFTDEELAQKLVSETGSRPEWSAHAFADVEQDVREGIERIRSSPFVPRTDNVRGFVYEVETGRLREVV
jgi:carbonic anhydrase